LIQADCAFHTQKPFFRQLTEQGADFLLTSESKPKGPPHRQIGEQFLYSRKNPLTGNGFLERQTMDGTPPGILRAKQGS